MPKHHRESNQGEEGMPHWLTSGVLIGSATIGADAYPIYFAGKDPETGDGVHITVNQPAEERQFLGLPQLRQVIDLHIEAPEDRVQEVAGNATVDLAAIVSFLTRRAVDLEPGVVVSETKPERRLLPFKRAGAWPPPVSASLDALNAVLDHLSQEPADRRQRLIRSMRWLRRARTTKDEIDVFASLAIAYEAVTGLLPSPAPKSTGKRTRKASGSERLSHFAVKHAGVAPGDWKVVGRLRHALFHGGLAEDRDTRDQLDAAVPALKKTIVEALRFLLKLPNHWPPDDPFDELAITLGSVSFTPSNAKTGRGISAEE